MIRLLLIAFLISFVPLTAQADLWYNSDWEFAKRITINSTLVDGTHRDFPILINFTDADLLASADPSGDDILFTLQNNVTKLDHEIEHYNSTNGWLVAWVRLPTLSPLADQDIFMYYGDTGGNGPQNNTNAVWNENYVGVWHFAGNLLDSTSFANHGTNEGSTDAACPIYRCRSFDGINDRIRINNNTEFNFEADTDPFTIQEITYIENLGNIDSFMRMVDKKLMGTDEGYTVLFNEGAETYDWDVENSAASTDGQETSTTGARQSWTWVATPSKGNGNRDGVNHLLNGTDYAFQVATILGDFNHTDDLVFGRAVHGTWDWDGRIDEIRISNKYIEPQWLNTEYNNQQIHTVNNFLLLGSEGSEPANIQTITIRIADAFRHHLAYVTNTNTSFDLSVTATGVEVPIVGNEIVMDTSFGTIDDGIVCNFNGLVMVTAHLYLTENLALIRGNLQFEILKNEVSLGIVSAEGYIRHANQDFSSQNVQAVSLCEIGDRFTLQTTQEGSSANITMATVGGSFMLVERLN